MHNISTSGKPGKLGPSKLRNILCIETTALAKFATLAHPYQNNVILAPTR